MGDKFLDKSNQIVSSELATDPLKFKGAEDLQKFVDYVPKDGSTIISGFVTESSKVISNDGQSHEWIKKAQINPSGGIDAEASETFTNEKGETFSKGWDNQQSIKDETCQENPRIHHG